MSKKQRIGREVQTVIEWLGARPGVTSVILGARPTGSRHQHKVGFTKVLSANERGVLVRSYGPQNSYDLFVNAIPSPLRDAWVAGLTGGVVVDKTTVLTPKPAAVVAAATPPRGFSAHVPAPRPVDSTAGQTFDVTPDLAAKWLERNTRNRTLRSDVVTRYAADMKAGRWMVTGDAIGFDTNGAIVNGQHRLWAVFESGMTVRMLAVFDLEPEVVRVQDDHLKRKLVDIIHIARPGINVQLKHAAIARVMMFNLTRTDRRSAASKIPRQEQLSFLERHLEAIDFAVRDCFHSRNTRALSHASVLAVVARAYYTQDRDRLVSFAKVFMSGMPDGQEDKAAIIFRNWLLRVEAQKMRAASEIIYRKGERALDAFLKKQSLTTLYEATEELFPLPEEVAPKKARTT
jgi:hypothetical protein